MRFRPARAHRGGAPSPCSRWVNPVLRPALERLALPLLVSGLLLSVTPSVEAQSPPVDTSGWPALRVSGLSGLPGGPRGEGAVLTTVRLEGVFLGGWSPFVGVAALRMEGPGTCASGSGSGCVPGRPPLGVLAGVSYRFLEARPNADREQGLIAYLGGGVTGPIRPDPGLPAGWVHAGADLRLADGWNLRGELQSRGEAEGWVTALLGLRVAVP